MEFLVGRTLTSVVSFIAGLSLSGVEPFFSTFWDLGRHGLRTCENLKSVCVQLVEVKSELDET